MDVFLEKYINCTNNICIDNDKTCACLVRIKLTSINTEICPDCKKTYKLIKDGRPSLNVGSSKDRGL